ncbi:hypothetical protein Tco_0324869 [Tanacetum coccineum]
MPSEKGESYNVKIKDLEILIKDKAMWKRLNDNDVVRVCLLLILEEVFMGKESRKTGFQRDEDDKVLGQDGGGNADTLKDSFEVVKDEDKLNGRDTSVHDENEEPSALPDDAKEVKVSTTPFVDEDA